MSENIQPASEENKIVEEFEKESLSENSTGVNVDQPTLNLEQNRFECRSCGYIYDPSEGNRKLNIPKIRLFQSWMGIFLLALFVEPVKIFIRILDLEQNLVDLKRI